MNTKTKIIICVALFVAGIIVGAFVQPTKEVRKIEDIKKIEELEKRIKSIIQTNEKIVEVVKADGSRITTTERGSTIRTDTKEEQKEIEKIKKDEKITYGTFGMGAVYTAGWNYQTIGVIADTKLFWRFNVQVGLHYNTINPNGYFSVGLIFR